MSSPVETSIRECLQWHCSAGRLPQPDRLFLGSKQHDALLCAARPFIGVIKPADITGEAKRPEYCGMKVYRVDAENFIGFGHDDPSPCG